MGGYPGNVGSTCSSRYGAGGGAGGNTSGFCFIYCNTVKNIDASELVV